MAEPLIVDQVRAGSSPVDRAKLQRLGARQGEIGKYLKEAQVFRELGSIGQRSLGQTICRREGVAPSKKSRCRCPLFPGAWCYARCVNAYTIRAMKHIGEQALEVEMRAVHGWMCEVSFDYNLGEAADGEKIYPSPEDMREHEYVNETDYRPIEVVTMAKADFDELVAKAGIDPATIRSSNIVFPQS